MCKKIYIRTVQRLCWPTVCRGCKIKHNRVYTDEYRKKLGIKENQIVIGHVGRLEEQKIINLQQKSIEIACRVW